MSAQDAADLIQKAIDILRSDAEDLEEDDPAAAQDLNDVADELEETRNKL